MICEKSFIHFDNRSNRPTGGANVINDSMKMSDWNETLTDGVHGDGAVSGLAERPGPGQVLSTHSEDVGESLHQAHHLHVQRVEQDAVDSGPVFAVHLLPLDPVAQDRAAVILRLVPRDVGGARRHLVDSGGVGSIGRIWGVGVESDLMLFLHWWKNKSMCHT